MRLADLLFPPRCLSCRKFLLLGGSLPHPPPADEGPIPPNPSAPHGQSPMLRRDGLCAACDAAWPFCGGCLTSEGACRRVRAAGLYRGILLEMVLRLKYRGEERLASFLGQRMGEVVGAESSPSYDVILPIPLHRARLRGRGFNQALLLAREVGKILEKEVNPFLLVKKRATAPQVTLKGGERQRNLKGSFGVKSPEKVEGKRILLVDDVYTTGTTIEEASRVLLKAGACEIEAVVLARTE